MKADARNIRSVPAAVNSPLDVASYAARVFANEKPCDDFLQRHLRDGALEFLHRPSKQFRANLSLFVSEVIGSFENDTANLLAASVELTHAGSLIIDDIQDQSKERRGGPTLHTKVGVGNAINIGNWMYFAGQALLHELPVSDGRKAQILSAHTATMLSCHVGQALDINGAIFRLPPEEIPDFVNKTTVYKTSKLLSWAALAPGLAAGLPDHESRALTAFGRALGIALQMLDDIGSMTAPSRRHKGLEDLKLARPTWPWAWLCALHPDEVRSWQQTLEHTDDHEFLLKGLADRTAAYGHAAVSQSLDVAWKELTTVFGSCTAVENYRREILRLETSYG